MYGVYVVIVQVEYRFRVLVKARRIAERSGSSWRHAATRRKSSRASQCNARSLVGFPPAGSAQSPLHVLLGSLPSIFFSSFSILLIRSGVPILAPLHEQLPESPIKVVVGAIEGRAEQGLRSEEASEVALGCVDLLDQFVDSPVRGLVGGRVVDPHKQILHLDDFGLKLVETGECCQHGRERVRAELLLPHPILDDILNCVDIVIKVAPGCRQNGPSCLGVLRSAKGSCLALSSLLFLFRPCLPLCLWRSDPSTP